MNQRGPPPPYRKPPAIKPRPYSLISSNEEPNYIYPHLFPPRAAYRPISEIFIVPYPRSSNERMLVPNSMYAESHSNRLSYLSYSPSLGQNDNFSCHTRLFTRCYQCIDQNFAKIEFIIILFSCIFQFMSFKFISQQLSFTIEI